MTFHHLAISRAFGICCALTLVASACGKSADSASSAVAGSVPTTGPAVTEPYIGPIDQFLGIGNGRQPTAAEQAEQQQRMRDLEQEITTCMQALGFQYIAQEPSDARRARKEALIAMPPGEYAAQYGYGISTLDFDDPAAVNPNDAIVEAMTVAERSAYYQALYGSMVTIDSDGRPVKKGGSTDAPPPGEESCSEKADISVFGEHTKSALPTEDSFVELRNSFDVLNDSIRNDARMVAAMTEWIDCMETKGHPGYTSFDDGRDEVQARADEVIGDRDNSEVDPAALSELRTFEIALATDEYDCSLDYQHEHEVVQTELEDAFVEAHRAELEQYRGAIADGTAGKG